MTTINGYRFKGVKRYLDRHRKTVRYYLRATAQRLPNPDEGFREFDRAYWEAVKFHEAGRKPVAPRPQASRVGTIEKAVNEYFNSDAFKKDLAPATQIGRRNMLGNWAAGEIGRVLVSSLRTQDIEQGLRNRAATPPAANNWLVAVRGLLDFCVSSKLIKVNPATGVKRLKVEQTGGFPDWTEADVVQFEQRWHKGSMQYRALQVLLVFGQRRSDVVRFNWSMVTADNMIEFEQQKTGAKMRLPVPASLLEVLPPRSNVVSLSGDAAPFLHNSRGEAFKASYFTNWFHAACVEAGLPHLSTHGTRKLAAKRLRKARCPIELIMAYTGHKTEKQLRVYLGDVEREEMADELRAWMGGAA